MKPIFAAKYISIKWFDRDNIVSVYESQFDIPVETIDAKKYHIELQTYTRLENGRDGQVAFKITDEQYKNVKPYFINANNEKNPLFKIKYNDDEWWIEDGSWNNKGKYKESPLWNHIGTAKIIFKDTTCNIDISAITFSKDELENYLKDFKNDFWYLILKQDSITQAKVKNRNDGIKLLRKEDLETISSFINYAYKILENAKKELRETQSFKDIKKVRPVKKTFKEIATSGYKKQLTSRDTMEVFDIPENRYIHYIIQRVYDIASQVQNISSNVYKDFLNDKIKDEQKRVENFQDYIVIDKSAFENDVKKLEEKFQKKQEQVQNVIERQKRPILQQDINLALSKQQIINADQPLNRFIIKLEKQQPNYQDKIQFWGKIRREDEQNWHILEGNLSLEFSDILNDILQPDKEYLIEANNKYLQAKENRPHKIFFYNIKKIIQLEVASLETVTIKLNKLKIFNERLQFSGTFLLENGVLYRFHNANNFYSLEFDRDIWEDILEENREYKITAIIVKDKQPWNKGDKSGIIHKRYFQYIESIKFLSLEKELINYKKQKLILEQNGWRRKLTFQEIEEQESEKKSLKKSIESLKKYNKNNDELIKELEPIAGKLHKLLKKCKNLSIKKDSNFPNSMTFIQNPNYQGAYKYYQKIKSLLNIDESIFKKIKILENIGLIDIPTLYERWCFLQIIKVLIDSFHFLPEENWKINLTSQILDSEKNQVNDKIKNIELKFSNEQIKRNITLWYEKELNSGKRPDFVLDIESTFGTQQKHRLIMDAKFHEQVDIKQQITELYHQKNYSENDKNTVFILHPDKNSIKEKRTPLIWGNEAFYAEVDMFDFEWDEDEFPNHKYGAILMSPIKRNGMFLDNLQRVIGLAMQYQMEDNEDIKNDANKIDPEPKEKIFCIKCGSSNYNGLKKITINNNGYRYQFTCKDCAHYFVYNYCWACKYRLIKNGNYWTYHSVQVLNPFDIKCPHCNRLLSELK